jgi:inorganic pyrophosphatase
MPSLEQIPHELDGRSRTCRVVVETPRGSRNKLTFDPELGAMRLKRRLPEGMAFPMDFGFVPATRAADGDPLDVMVLMDEPTPSGVVVEVRLVGVIEAQQASAGEPARRNDRLVGVCRLSRLYARVRQLHQLGDDFINDLASFWIDYNRLCGRSFEVLGVRDGVAAVDLVRKAGLR